MSDNTGSFYRILEYGKFRPPLVDSQWLNTNGVIYEGKTKLTGYQMFSFGSFPFIKGGVGEVVCDVYKVERRMIDFLDYSYGCDVSNSDEGLFVRYFNEKANGYYYAAGRGLSSVDNSPRVVSGDWVRYLKEQDYFAKQLKRMCELHPTLVPEIVIPTFND